MESKQVGRGSVMLYRVVRLAYNWTLVILSYLVIVRHSALSVLQYIGPFVCRLYGIQQRCCAVGRTTTRTSFSRPVTVDD